MEIVKKAQFLALNKQGHFGNRLRYWDRPNDIAADSYTGLISIRSRRADVRLPTHVPWSKLGATLRSILFNIPGYTLEDLYFCESAPDDQLYLQGEFVHAEARYGALIGPTLRFNTNSGLNMRQAMASDYRDAEGIVALEILRTSMSPNSWEDFNILRDNYPNCAIELGIYCCYLGSFPFRNTIIWEVRNY